MSKLVPVGGWYTGSIRLWATVDDDDYDSAIERRWTPLYDGRNIYAKSSRKVDGKVVTVKLHQFVMQANGARIDHKNGDGLDCRKENLRYANGSQNAANKRKREDSLTSQYKGVSFAKDVGKYRAMIYKDGAAYSLGFYTSELEAARIYDEKARELFGEFARVNFT